MFNDDKYALEPMSDWVLVEPIKLETGLTLPDAYDPRKSGNDYESVTILAMGPATHYVEMGCEIALPPAVVGDEVIVEGLSVPMFEYKRKKFYAIRKRNIAFIVRK